MEILKDLEKLAALKWEENNRFRRWLKDKDAKEVEDTADRMGRAVAAEIDCTQCGNCCKALTIVPKSSDIHRLSDHLGIDAHDFKEKYLKQDHEGDLVFKQRPCPFLKGTKCGVYEARPETCRSYPHLEKSHMSGRGWYILENTSICPIVYKFYEEMKLHYNFHVEL